MQSVCKTTLTGITNCIKFVRVCYVQQHSEQEKIEDLLENIKKQPQVVSAKKPHPTLCNLMCLM